MPELRRDRPADGRYILGVQGSGKTWAVQRAIENHRGRVIAWDWKGYDYPELRAVSLQQLAREALHQRARLRYCPEMMPPPSFMPGRRDRGELWIAHQFDLFCRIAWAAQVEDPHTDCLFIVEELSEVTTASWAPPAWRRINVQGRAYGFIVVGTTQRPAFVDKSFSTNATTIRCGRLGDALDAKVMSQRLGVPVVNLQRLPDRWAYVFDGRETRLINPRGKPVPHVSATG